MFRVLIPTPLFLILGCSSPEMPIEIPFDVRFGDAPIGCSSSSTSGFSLTDLRFYAYDFTLVTETGDEVPLELIPDPMWQSEGVALVDFEDGQGSCANGSAGINTAVRGLAAPASYAGLRFRVGVPERLNHRDPLRAAPPLNDSSMHWHWVSGYRFLRAGVVGGSDGFWLHLGSTRCEGTVTDIEGCKASNRVDVRLSAFDPARDAVIVDLERLVEGVKLADGTPGDCSSGPAETACAAPFAALGIDFETGAAVAPATVFRAGRAR